MELYDSLLMAGHRLQGKIKGMSRQSGGAMAANAREGFRSESLARFALSAFGPATDVEVEDDHGVDLVCATAARVGPRLHIGPGYLVQVKSDDVVEVTYEGPNARAWLEGLGSPLLVCRVDKATTRIRLYSTWSLSRVLVQHAVHGGPAPDTFRLVMEQPVTTAEPSAALVPLGAPIVDFKITDLHATAFTDNIRSCIAEWVSMDTENIVRRRSGLAIAKGYTNPKGTFYAA